MSPTPIQRLRQKALAFLNARSAERFVSSSRRDIGVPTYMILTPHLVHMAPLAATDGTGPGPTVFVLNGVDAGDAAWLRSVRPDLAQLSFRASFSRAEGSLLPHGEAIDALIQAEPEQFLMQDPDCFPLSESVWDSMRIDRTREFAVGPFLRRGLEGRPDFPETFLLHLNSELAREHRTRFGVRAAVTRHAPRACRTLLDRAGYAPGQRVEVRKDYYDTLQLFWATALGAGYRYRVVPGAETEVVHLGGTSYLYHNFDDLTHWNYWPMSIHYFNLRLLEAPSQERFRGRFRKLLQHHGGADALLASNPEFARGPRRQATDALLAHFHDSSKQRSH